MKRYTAFISIALNGLLICILLYILSNPTKPQSTPIKNPSNQFPYLSQRIFTSSNDQIINFVPLRDAMTTYINKSPYSINAYFEYLPSGISIGINDEKDLQIASLIKLPLIMTLYKEIEKGVLHKNDVLTVQKEDIDNGYGNLWEKGVGYKLTVDDAIHLALQQSDNTAARALMNALPQGTLDTIFDSLDIPKRVKDNSPILSPHYFSSILKSLFLSSYLPYKDSNEILETMSHTVFLKGIPAGVGKGVTVAHKIGSYNTQTQQSVFSDCGIVYVPQRPYLLCIMVEGQNETQADAIIAHLSKMIYGYIVLVKGS